ncbi:hypothetical protein BBK36DRAFT_1178062 [Trichoderma citrinoviride]|uniref:JmjC domain-containing protein n=1 Tax=Trichoderma citrinoviride TaxID=58853 RepID=A0A2T4B3Y9_9HYPO|nr:hypothetical protein BBK36DRAFT_1178062 [Trichoderma citrinoviride]PTB64056.1 hypothetical protein BBK36DRAFT_1178062 [Trichoderma citrinoviride]
MPGAQHPQAKFDPLPPDLDLPSLVDRTPNFRWAQRVSRAQIRSLSQQDFEKLVAIHVIAGGKPLVIEGWDAVLPSSLFSAGWLEHSYDKKQENVRDISNGTDIPMTMGHYLRSMRQLTNQWTPSTYRDERRQRLYLKDIDCPVEWREALQKIIHPNLFYLNENVTSKGGKRMHDDEVFESETTAAPAGDLMSSLPEEMRAQNLMCYIGHEGTYTPAHREMCASLGQNIMVEASRDENGEKRGSSIWFMTESKDREVVREYFLSMLGHDIEIEKHFAQVNAWKKAPFDVYIVEQCVGDFILIPPLAAHQVWNRGTRTMKVAWNRTTVETLDLALHEALPKARLVCRDEQYKNKAIIYYTLQKYHAELQGAQKKAEMVQIGFPGFGRDVFRSSPRVKQLAADFKKLFELFTEILVDEVFAFKEKDVEFLPFDSCVTCSYCRSNIFNRFLTCKHCIRPLINGEEDAYDVCMECYAMGRSCACLSGLQWCEQWSWSELTDNYEAWRATVIAIDGHVDLERSPHPLEVARQRTGKKSLAQICQEALRRRPWKDITKPEREITPSDSEPGDGEGKLTKKPKKKRKKKGELQRCHVCCHPDYSYRVHSCTNPGCSEAYCYGVLYRAFDLMPQTVLEDEHWQCPKCLGICNCGHCRRAGITQPYMPKNTSLGHDTRRIADDRSVEALVDFRIHNLSWLKAAGEESRSRDSKRMQLLREQADNAKAQDALTQDQAEPRMHPSTVFTTQLEEAHAINGYGDQSHVLGRDGNPPEFTLDVPNGQPRGVDNAPQEAAAPIAASAGEVVADSSQYPDPSVFARQRIGMGYYEQDDTPDKILFDPYQAPSTDSLQADEPTVPEFVKKSIRAAKRKAKRENEDPEFTLRKSHHKRPKLIPESSDFLDTMDPALFADGGSAAMATPAAPLAPMDNGASATSSAAPGEDPEPKAPRMTMPQYDANEPILRHAKPRASYVEETAVPSWPSPPLAGSSTKAHTSASGDKTQAVHANGNGQESSKPEEKPSDLPTREANGDVVPKRRGRPPRNLSKKASSAKRNHNSPPPRADSQTGKRRRGRPRKSLSTSFMEPDDSHEEDEDDVDAEAAFDDADDADFSPARNSRSRRGTSLDVVIPVHSQFMSMAERMALKGRGRSAENDQTRRRSLSSSSKESTDDEDIPSNGRMVRSTRR